jgi:hypothetical protein
MLYFVFKEEKMFARGLLIAALSTALTGANAVPSLAQTDPADTNVVRIDTPMVDGVLLDWCRVVGEKCGQPAADAFCKAGGHRRSVRFVQWVNPNKPTRIISNGVVCDSPECDSFRWIECRK